MKTPTKQFRNPVIGSLGFALGLFALAPEVQAQQLMGIDGPAATVRLFNGGKCECPSLDPAGLTGQFDYVQSNACLTPKPFSDLSMAGGVAHNIASGVTYVTDGQTIGAYSPMPEYKILCHFERPEGMHVLTGMGFGDCPDDDIWPPKATSVQSGLGQFPGGDTLWVTDGFSFAEIRVPACVWGCQIEPTKIVKGPFDFPYQWAGLATGISYDPKKEALFFSTSTGNVLSLDCDGSENLFVDWSVSSPNLYWACQLDMMLTGITVDRSYLTTGTVFVTDGAKYIRVNWGGFPANNPMTPAFAWKCDFCYDVPDGYGTSNHEISGLAYTLKCNTYSKAGASFGDATVKIKAPTESFLGNDEFSVHLTGAPAASISILIFGMKEKCPQMGVLPIAILPFHIIDTAIISGSHWVNVPLPDDYTLAGQQTFFQFLSIDPWGSTQATQGLACQLGCAKGFIKH